MVQYLHTILNNKIIIIKVMKKTLHSVHNFLKKYIKIPKMIYFIKFV